MKSILAFLIAFSLFSADAMAGMEMHDFYKEASGFDLQASAISAGIITAALAAVGAVVFLVFPPAGLVLIGWGAVAGTGGIVGAVLIGSALAFSTDVVIDYAYENAKQEYSYRKFREESKDLVNLPLFMNSEGSELYSKLLENLKNMKDESGGGLSSIISDPYYDYAIEALLLKKDRLGLDEKEATLLAKMYFARDDYNEAGAISEYFIYGHDFKNPLITFIYSTSLLYSERPDFKISYDYFFDSLERSEDSTFWPMMYAIYMDRLFYRTSQGDIGYQSYLKIMDDTYKLEYSRERVGIQVAILMRMLASAKLEQQKIIAIHSGPRDYWREDDVVSYVADSLDAHIMLIEAIGEELVFLKEDVEAAIDSRLISRQRSFEKEAVRSIQGLEELIPDYREGYSMLRSKIEDIDEVNSQSWLRRIF